MQAKISSNNELVIEVDNSTEAYALQQWSLNLINGFSGSKLKLIIYPSGALWNKNDSFNNVVTIGRSDDGIGLKFT